MDSNGYDKIPVGKHCVSLSVFLHYDFYSSGAVKIKLSVYELDLDHVFKIIQN